MTDLGKYAGTVLGAWGATLVLISVLVVLSLLRARRVRRELAQLEQERKR